MEQHGRVDQWLKLVCLFKHRSEAAEACRGGKVKVNGGRVKPAAAVKPGDVVEVTDGERYRKVVVLGVPERHVSKEVARTEMYRDETPEKPREPAAPKPLRDRGTGRPTKKDRRDIEKWGK
jgi:ribosome-associated heat shock protein Hsp15